jgi:hypothetical protein
VPGIRSPMFGRGRVGHRGQQRPVGSRLAQQGDGPGSRAGREGAGPKILICDNRKPQPAPAQDTVSVLFGMEGVEVTEAERGDDGHAGTISAHDSPAIPQSSWSASEWLLPYQRPADPAGKQDRRVRYIRQLRNIGIGNRDFSPGPPARYFVLA